MKRAQKQTKGAAKKIAPKESKDTSDLFVTFDQAENNKSDYEDSGNESFEEDIDEFDNEKGFYEGLGGETKKMDPALSRAIAATKVESEARNTSTEQKVLRRQKKIVETIGSEDEDTEIAAEKQNANSKKEKSNKELKEKKVNKKKLKTWQDLAIVKPILKAVEELHYAHPTHIQALSIPAAIQGKDILASSLTGSGKTAAFLIPILQKLYRSPFTNYSKALIVTPTRELAFQCYEMFSKLNLFTKIRACLVIGASSMQKQEAELRGNPEIIIATPGRLIDHMQNSRSIDLDNLEILVFDEADKLLELGFEAEIKNIVENCNKERQTLLFSATLNSEVNKLIDLALKKPVRIQANPDGITNDKLTQKMLKIAKEDQREAALLAVAAKYYKERTIIFFKTKKQCHRMAIIFGLFKLKVCELHGDLSQSARIQAFSDFKEGKYQYLMATDLAARGLDIQGLKAVINFELPQEATRYIHRVGRTARAGNEGVSLTIGLEDELKTLKKMLKENKDKFMDKLAIGLETLEKYASKIGSIERQVGKVLQEEQTERHFRKAEMEIKKAENMLKFNEEIMNKPKKSWFISNQQKNQIKKATRAIAFGEQPPK